MQSKLISAMNEFEGAAMKGPKKAIIEVSRRCNAKCIMCGYQANGSAVDSEMSLETFKKAVAQSDFQMVRLNGRGESTTNAQLLDMLECAGTVARTELFTNGNYDNDRLNDAFTAHATQLFFSIDSPVKDELEQIRRAVSFEKLVHNIDSQKKNPTRPYLCFTLQEVNVNRILDMAKFACDHLCNITYNAVRRDKGIETFVAVILKEKSRIKDEFFLAKSICKENGVAASIPCQIAGVELFGAEEDVAVKTNAQSKVCPCLENEVFIASDGSVGPCNMFNPYVYGNINEASFPEIWNGKRRHEFIAGYKQNYYCKNCACMGGE